MEQRKTLKTVIWVGDSKTQIKKFPRMVQRDIGEALMFAQAGDKHALAKPFKGVGSGVFEIAKQYDTNTYRAVYALHVGNTIYVLHAFQKKAKRGIKTPRRDIALIKQRMRAALELEKAKK